MIVPPGLSRPVALGVLDHLDRHAVLDRVAGVEGLDLREHGGLHDAAGDAVDADQRRVADGVEDGVADLLSRIKSILGQPLEQRAMKLTTSSSARRRDRRFQPVWRGALATRSGCGRYAAEATERPRVLEAGGRLLRAGGFFRSDNLLSNETTYQEAIPELRKRASPERRLSGRRAGPELHLHHGPAARAWRSSSTSGGRTCSST